MSLYDNYDVSFWRKCTKHSISEGLKNESEALSYELIRLNYLHKPMEKLTFHKFAKKGKHLTFERLSSSSNFKSNNSVF